MTALHEARQHCEKASEFLRAAESNLGLELFNAATSDAVVSGINSKDAICLKLTGQTRRGDNHLEAVDELRKAGSAGREVSPALNRLVRLKSRSQYQSGAVSRRDAEDAVKYAKSLLEAAKAVLTS